MKSGTIAGPDMGFLADHIGFQLHLGARYIWQKIRAKHRKSLPSGFHAALVLIGLNPGISPKQISTALFLDSQATVTVLDRLEHEGFAVRTRSTVDKRRIELTLTKQGQEQVASVKQVSEMHESEIGANLSQAEIATLVKLLAKLRG